MSLTTNTPNLNKDSKPEQPMRRLVISTLMLILVVLGVFLVTGMADGVVRSAVIVLAFVLIGMLIIAVRGNPKPGQYIAPIGVLLTILLAAYNGKGFFDEILIGSPAAIVLAGLLLGSSWSVIISFLLIVGISVIGFIEMGGTRISEFSALVTLEDIITADVTIVAIALLLRLLIGRLNSSTEDARRNSDALTRSNRELRILQADLEKRVNERTLQLNKRAVQLQASSEVGRAVSSISNLHDLLDNVTTLISERFGYYHVGVFLVDRAGENAVLRASNSPGGRRMVENGHSLPVGSRSIVGYVTQHRDPRIAIDVGRDATFFNNPDLPQTRSEMALPLIAAGRLLGALDVQSSEPAAFTQDDVSVLQVLADQVAIAIENSNLFTEARAALEASRRAYGDLSREEWIKRLQGHKDVGYQFDDRGNIVPVESGWSKELIEARNADQPVRLDDMTLAMAFKISDLPLGVVKLKKQPGSRAWTEREISLIEAVIGNLGEALESARLYENTQKRAERERLTADISSSIRENLDVEAVLRTAVVQIRQALNLANVEVRLKASNLVEQSRETDNTGMSEKRGIRPEDDSGSNGNGTNGGNSRQVEPKRRSK
jgi:GAF domain-containing protein